MKNLILITIIIVFFIEACSIKKGNEKDVNQKESWEISLNGEDWELVQFEPGQGIEQNVFDEGYPLQEAIQSTVPGDVHWDLERNGKIPPIFYGTNSQEIGWVSGKEWWYRKIFTIPDNWKNKNIRLHFDGVDYLADVWLNGIHIGQHEGQMTPFEFDITNQLKHGEKNALTVLIYPAPKIVQEVVPFVDTVMNKTQYRPVMVAMREAYPCWKADLLAGWDFGTKIVTMGIWKDVRLLTSENVYLSEPIVLPELTAPFDEATLKTSVKVYSEKAREVELEYQIKCLTAKTRTVVANRKIAINAGSQQIPFEIKIKNPKLWWPNGYGKQHLYKMEIIAKERGGNKICHLVDTEFGIRDLQIIENPEPFTKEQINSQFEKYYGYSPSELKLTDSKRKQYGGFNSDLLNDPTCDGSDQYRYLMQINGRRIFARGCNWVPTDLLYGRQRMERYKYFLKTAADANCNVLRVWGGGIIEKKDFYDFCDRYGIMIFQDFPWAGPRPADTDKALNISDKETREVLPLLMNHPSIVRYCGGNEWRLTSNTNRHLRQLQTLCNEIDPTRPYYGSSPVRPFQQHGGYWYNSNVYNHYNSKGRNPCEWTEFGIAGITNLNTIKKIVPENEIWPVDYNNSTWILHKAFYAYGKEQWLGMPAIKKFFGNPSDIESLTKYGQFIQAEGLRYACQSMRRFRWHRSACATWNFNEPWPNIAHSSVVDYFGNVTMAYHYLRQAYAPVDVSAVYSSLEIRKNEPLEVELWGINDHLKSLNGYYCRYRITNLRGEILKEQQILAEVPSEGNIKIGEVKWTPPAVMAGETVLLWLDLIAPSGNAVAQHVYTFGIEEQKDNNIPLLHSMVNMPKTNISSKIVSSKTNSDGEIEVKARIKNDGGFPAMFVKLDVVEPEATDLVKNPPFLYWVYFDENYFSLMPAEEREVRITFTSNAPQNPIVKVVAWNTNIVQF